MVGTADVAAFPDHDVEAAGSQGGECFQGLVDEGQVGVDARGAGGADARQAGLAQDAFDAAVVDVQLPGNGADAPFLDVVIAQNLGFKFRAQAHG